MRRRSPSFTAVKVARGVVHAGCHPRLSALLPPEAARSTRDLLRSAGLCSKLRERVYQLGAFRLAVHWLDRALMGGILPGLVLRKRFLDDEIEDAIASGARQVLVLGAGLDASCLRKAPRHPDVQFVELDHPATHVLKAPAVERLGSVAENLHLLAVDLGEVDLRDALDACTTWSWERTSVVVAEGLFMYLPERAVLDVLGAVADRATAATRVLFTYVGVDRRGLPVLGARARFVRAALRLVGEPLRWGIEPEALPAFLGRCGLRLDADRTRMDLAARYLREPELASIAVDRSEHAALAHAG